MLKFSKTNSRTDLHLSAALAGLTFLVSACGSTVDVDDGSGGGGGTGGSGGTGGVGGMCSGYAHEEPLGGVTFTIVNESDRTIYLPYNCGGLSSSVEPLDTPSPGSGSSCLTCEEAVQNGFAECPVGGACQNEVLVLETGASTTISWGGLGGSEDLPLTAQCGGVSGGQECLRFLAAAAGDYQFLITGYDTCEDCECDPGQDTCIGYASGTEALPVPAIFSFPSEDEVRVVFEPCTFGCAAPG